MGRGVPEARRQGYNSPMNSDLSETTTRRRAKMPFLGRTLDRGPTNTELPFEETDIKQNNAYDVAIRMCGTRVDAIDQPPF